MKAYQYRKGSTLSDLCLVECPVPRPGPGQVLVKIHSVSLNYRDLLVVTGKYPGFQPDNLIPLSDGAGEVVELGNGVESLKIGARVTPSFFQSWKRGEMLDTDRESTLGGSVNGVAAQYCVFDADGLLEIPPHLGFEEAATLPCAALTAWNGLHGPQPLTAGETVLTLGTGGVSIFALQLAQAAGAKVVITSSSEKKLEKAHDLGADKCINYAECLDWEKEVLEFTDGRGVDHVIETVGGGTIGKSIVSTRRGGWIHVIGLISAGQIDSADVLLGGVKLRGVEVGSLEMHAAMNRSFSHSLITPVIDRSFPFGALPDALRYLQGGHHFGKVILTMD